MSNLKFVVIILVLISGFVFNFYKHKTLSKEVYCQNHAQNIVLSWLSEREENLIGLNQKWSEIYWSVYDSCIENRKL